MGFFATYTKRPMRFRLHQKASSGQATKNKATIDALLLRVDELESAGPSGGTSLVQPRSRARTQYLQSARWLSATQN